MKFKGKRLSWGWYVAAVILAFIAFNLHYGKWYEKEISYVATPVHAGVTLESKVEDMKEDVLNKLASCESGGRKEEDGITVLDSNGVGSYGALQWQRKSFMFYWEKMTGTPINGRDAIIAAMTPEKARQLAKWVIFETDSGVAKDWVICSRKHNLQLKVDFIKELTK